MAPQTAAALLRLGPEPLRLGKCRGASRADGAAGLLLSPPPLAASRADGAAGLLLSLPPLALTRFSTLLAVGCIPKLISLFLCPFISYLFDLI
ncbi:hypothetical protein ACQJBY_068569 [Aegilops geniculata]